MGFTLLKFGKTTWVHDADFVACDIMIFVMQWQQKITCKEVIKTYKMCTVAVGFIMNEYKPGASSLGT